MKQWKQQVDKEADQISEHILNVNAKGVTTILVGVPANELAISNDQTKHMREYINKGLSKIANQHSKAQVISVNDDLDDEDAWADYRHYSEMMCGKVLESINRALDDKLLRRKFKPTTPKKYAHVHASYRLGCGVCTLTTHSEETCKYALAKKRPASSSSLNSPPHKKGN